MVTLYTELHRNILDQFSDYRVQIMTLAYERDPTQSKVVERRGGTRHWRGVMGTGNQSPGG